MTNSDEQPTQADGSSAKKATAKKATAKKATAKKATAKKATAKKATAKKATAEPTTAKKATEKKATAAARSDEPASLTLDVLDRSGDKVGSVDLPSVWFDGEVNIGVMHQVVTAQLAAARQGTHKTRTRAEVRGGGRKPWRQKGTGRARQGSIRAPQWVGGGVAHGRVPKDWSVRVNKKVKRAALRSALTDRARSSAVRVVRDLAFDAPRTKDAVAMLGAVDAADVKALVVIADWHESTVKSVRNLPNVHLLVVDQLNTHDVVNSDVVVFEEGALELIGTGRRASTPESAEATA